MKRPLVEERGSEFTQSRGVAREQIGGEAGESLRAAVRFDNASRVARRNEFSIRVARRGPGGRTPHFESLRVGVTFMIAVEDYAEAHAERQVLARVAIEIEAERIKTFITERVGSGLTRVRVHRHRHHGRSRPPAEKVEVADVDPGIFPRGRRVEMVGHSGLA